MAYTSKFTGAYIDEGIEWAHHGSKVLITNATEFSSLSANKCYEINKDFTLAGNVSFPSGVTLDFNGGSLNCGSRTLTLNGVKLVGSPKLTIASATLSGKFGNSELHLNWFDVNPAVSASANNQPVIQKVFDSIPTGGVVWVDDMYGIASTLYINSDFYIKGIGGYEEVYALYTSGHHCGFYVTGYHNCIEINSGGYLRMIGISLIGFANLFTGGSLDNAGSYTCTVDLFGGSFTKNFTVSYSGSDFDNRDRFCGIHGCDGDKDSNIEFIDKCSITGFHNGIWSYAGYIGRVQNTNITCCRFGLNVEYTSDFDIMDCHFNSACKGYDHSSFRFNTTEICKTSAGVRLFGVGMSKLQGCKFEFGFSGICLDGYVNDCKISDCDFDEHTAASIVFNNDQIVGLGKRFPAFAAVTVTNCTFLRGVQRRAIDDASQVLGAAHFLVKRLPYPYSRDEENSVYLVFSGCSVSDFCLQPGEEIAQHQPYIFYLDNGDDDLMRIDCAACNFGNSDSKLIGCSTDTYSNYGGIVQLAACTLPNGGVGDLSTADPAHPTIVSIDGVRSSDYSVADMKVVSAMPAVTDPKTLYIVK